MSLDSEQWHTFGGTIADIKAKIEESQGVPPHQQRLFAAGRELEDKRSLQDYEIGKGSFLSLAVRQVAAVKVRTLTGEAITINTAGSATISLVKAKIRESQRDSLTNGARFRLMYAGQELLDGLTMLDYGIPPASILQMEDLDQHAASVCAQVIADKMFIVDILPSDTIGNVRTKLVSKAAHLDVEGISPTQELRICFATICFVTGSEVKYQQLTISLNNIAKAVEGYAAFHGRQAKTICLVDVLQSSAGIEAWLNYSSSSSHDNCATASHFYKIQDVVSKSSADCSNSLPCKTTTLDTLIERAILDKKLMEKYSLARRWKGMRPAYVHTSA